MKVVADTTVCQGHGQCEDAAPEVFEVDDDDGVVRLKREDVGDDLLSQVRDAVMRCPTDALSVRE